MTSSSGCACTRRRRRAGNESGAITAATVRATTDTFARRARRFTRRKPTLISDAGGVDYPGLAGRTGDFSHGAPHAVTVGADGARVVFLRSSGPFDSAAALWVLDRETFAEHLVAPGPVDSYAVDRDARVA